MNKKITLKKLNLYSLCVYITTLFILVHDANLVIVSEFFFILYLGTTVLKVLSEKKIKFNIKLLPLILLSLYSILSLTWAIDKTLATTRVITMIQMTIFVIFIYQTIEIKDDIRLLIKSILIGGLGMSIFSLFYYGVNGVIYSIINNVRIGGEITQTNLFGYYSLISFIISTYMYFVTKKYKYILSSLLPLIFVFASGSRRSLIILVGGVLLIYMLNSIRNNKTVYFLAMFTIILVLSPVLINFIESTAFGERLSFLINFVEGQGEVDNSLLVRNSLIQYGNEVFKENPIFGYGINQFPILAYLSHGTFITSHNNYINVAVEFGLIGLILYYGLFLSITYNLTKNFLKTHDSIAGILVVLLVISLSGDMAAVTIWDKYTYILLSLGISYIAEKLNEEKQQKGNSEMEDLRRNE